MSPVNEPVLTTIHPDSTVRTREWTHSHHQICSPTAFPTSFPTKPLSKPFIPDRPAYPSPRNYIPFLYSKLYIMKNSKYIQKHKLRNPHVPCTQASAIINSYHTFGPELFWSKAWMYHFTHNYFIFQYYYFPAHLSSDISLISPSSSQILSHSAS